MVEDNPSNNDIGNTYLPSFFLINVILFISQQEKYEGESYMKVVLASTPEQEHHIEELIHYIYSDIFPRYFSDEIITKFEDWNILHPMEYQVNYNGTLKEAFQVISSLQTLIAVLETVQHGPVQENYRNIFEKNVKILNKYGFSFPFTLDQFVRTKKHIFSQYAKPTNRLLI
jgi:hypothetical protein